MASFGAEEPEVDETEEDAGAAAAALALERNAVKKLLAEYDKLDYEDDIGGLKTRFHYRTVAKEDYGLSTDEILRLKDKELNQLVGLKQMAPYREERGKFRPNYGKMKELQIGQEQKQAKWQQRQQKRQEQKARSKQKPPAADALVTAQAPGADGLPAKKAPADAKAQRMKSFQKLTLKRSKPSGSNHGLTGIKKKAAAAPASQSDSAAAGLSKAARKNMKRAAKRASKRAQNDSK